MSEKNKITIFPILFRSSNIQKLYKSIEYFNLKVIHNHFDNSYESSIYSHRLIPEYFNLNLQDNSFKTKVIPEYNWGYSILLNNQDSIEAFMKRQFNSKKRNIFTRYVRRLETCFNIEYKMFYGKISKTDYNFVMQSLYNMIINRFEERNELHKNLHEWDELLQNTQQEIINKKASLFVIYNKNVPIEISLNYHFDKILFSYISSFDIDYSKFGLGHVEIYKQIEWCANNGYLLFEMGVGGMDYKRRWSNNIYRYMHYVVYKNISIKIQLLIIKIQFKEYLKSKKLNEVLPKLKSLIIKKHKKTTRVTLSEIKHNDGLNKSDFVEIDFVTKPYDFLKKYKNDFLYSTRNHEKEITVYANSNKNSFLLQGKNNHQIVSFTKQNAHLIK